MPNGEVKIVEYDPSWPMIFEKEKIRLFDACGDKILEIEHIGSTSVPGLGAKNIIDILIAVEKLEIADTYLIDVIQTLGYEYNKNGEDSFPERRLFCTIPGKMDCYCHIHLVEKSTGFWEKHQLFRDYLRDFEDVRDAYFRLKKDLEFKFKNQRERYTESKTEFIDKVMDKAREYYT